VSIGSARAHRVSSQLSTIQEQLRSLHSRDPRGIAQQLLDIFVEALYVVITEYHRKYIDANRSSDCAFEVLAAKEYYDEYHNTLCNFVNDIRTENGGLGLLFDIHGTQVIDDDHADLYLGTDSWGDFA
jgi:DNA gyrase/topoisomerase IV subunit B